MSDEDAAIEERALDLRRLRVRVQFALSTMADELAQAAMQTLDREDLRYIALRADLAIGHAKAVCELSGSSDPSLLASGWVCGRAAIEAACLCFWLDEPEEPERGARVVAIIEETIRTMERLEPSTGDKRLRDEHMAILSELRRIKVERAEQLPRGTAIPRIPGKEDLARSVGGGALYELYVLGSQFTHSTQFSVAVHPNLAGEPSLLRELRSWALLLKISWEAARAGFMTAMKAASVAVALDDDLLETQILGAIRAFLT